MQAVLLLRMNFALRYQIRPCLRMPSWSRKCALSFSSMDAYIERYNRTVRHEWLDQHIIENIEEAQDFATQWLWTYNNDRPNMGIGGITPAMKLKMAA